jgi:hypothetical protein
LPLRRDWVRPLTANPALLIIHNQKALMEAALKRNDPTDVLIAAKSIVKASEGVPDEE